MSNLKKYAKYILLIIVGMLLTNLLTFIGFNLNYSDISQVGELSEQISIAKAEASKTDARVYGYVKNIEENDLNGKILKVSIYNDKGEMQETQYLKIHDVEYGTQKLFKVRFSEKNVVSYSVEICSEESTDESMWIIQKYE